MKVYVVGAAILACLALIFVLVNSTLRESREWRKGELEAVLLLAAFILWFLLSH
jgi:hypothetical protein